MRGAEGRRRGRMAVRCPSIPCTCAWLALTLLAGCAQLPPRAEAPPDALLPPAAARIRDLILESHARATA